MLYTNPAELVRLLDLHLQPSLPLGNGRCIRTPLVRSMVLPGLPGVDEEDNALEEGESRKMGEPAMTQCSVHHLFDLDFYLTQVAALKLAWWVQQNRDESK